MLKKILANLNKNRQLLDKQKLLKLRVPLRILN